MDFKAESLADISAMFREMAKRQDELERQAASQRQRVDIRACARTWRDAADIIDATILKTR